VPSVFFDAIKAWKVCLLLIIFCFVAPIAIAQSGAGTIQGTVTDVSDAQIAGVAVTATKNYTKISVSTKTDSAGFYILPGLFTGQYTLTFTAPQFKTYRPELQLLVAQTAQVDIPCLLGKQQRAWM